MKPATRISEAEWDIMLLAWNHSPIAASEIVEQLEAKRGWRSRTTRTLLDRLVKKGALTFEVDGKRYLYRPKVSMQKCLRKESQSFMQRVFGGQPGPMLVHLVENTELSAADIQKLKDILKEKEK